MLRSGAVLPAIFDGLRRAASAPAVLVGALALTFLFSVPLSRPLLLPFVVFQQYLAILPLSTIAGALYGSHGLTWLVVWSFLAGGVLDRYARNRPTRGRGFFGACGAHFPAMLRLAVAEWLVWRAMSRADLPRYLGAGAEVVLLASGLVFLYARVRLVVEDRRSALGALLAGGRFIRRNPAAVLIFLIFAAAIWMDTWLWAQVSSQLSDADPLATAAGELLVALLLFLVFASWASAAALFQSRLAHASYTAGPPLEWPESPAAEAITNLAASRLP
jgi:hypothetical protein